MNYIITRNKDKFDTFGYAFCTLEEMVLPDRIAVDTETDSLTPEIQEHDMFCCQIGTGKNNYVIDLENWGVGRDRILFKEIVPFIQDKTLVFHNADFDLRWMYKHNFFPKSIYDTMLASQVLYANQDRFFRDSYGNIKKYSHTFGDVMELELKLLYDKSDQKHVNKTRFRKESNLRYFFNDVDKLLDLHDVLEGKLVLDGSHRAYLFQCNFVKAQAYMGLCGLPIDEKLWKKKMEEDLKSKEISEKMIIKYVYENLPQFRDIQYNLFDNSMKLCISPGQKDFINVFKALGINTVNEQTGKESIAEDVINKTPHPFVDIWLSYQGHTHNVSTFGQNVLDKAVNGRIYSNFRTIVDTGRMVCRKGSINFLNFPSDKNTRSAFKAKKGHVMIGCDYDAQESKILAWKSQDENAKKNILENRDAHSLLARQIFTEISNLSDKEIKEKHGDKRQMGKIAGLKKNYTFKFVFAI